MQVYELNDLNHKQQTVVICAMEAAIRFLTNDPTYIPLTAIVIGTGGTGKSFIINTLIFIIQRYTHRNGVVQVAAPSGGSAYNIGGCTLYCCLSLSVDTNQRAKDLSEQKQIDLTNKLKILIMLVIDKRSMLSSGLIAASEHNIRHCVYGQQYQTELWGGIPVVLIFGDNY